MQIPKTELIYSYPLNKLFIKEFKHSDLSHLKKQCTGFEDIYAKNISKDLTLIQTFAGFDWNKTYILIYVVKNCPQSISNPLILRYQENPAFMYTLLLHELVHNNLEGNVPILQHNQLEVYVNAVVRSVLKKSPDATLLREASQEKSWNKMLKLGINLTEKRTLRAILFKGIKRGKRMPEIEDTYAEAFDGLFCRILITAKDELRLKRAAYGSTALPMVVVGRTEGGVEKWLNPAETPDKRLGALIQFWGNMDERKGFEASLNKFIKEVSYRIRQEILVEPTTCVFNALDSATKFDVMDTVGHCGDGYEWEEEYFGRNVINVPLMMPDFRIERYLGYGVGVSGGNLWLMCQNESSALEAGDKALEAIHSVEGVITPFDICSAGSKPETKYPEIGPTTNHPCCPSLKSKIAGSKVPEGVNSIPEIVINGVSLTAVKEAMKKGIETVEDMRGVVRISAGNYGGRLGKHKIYLKEL